MRNLLSVYWLIFIQILWVSCSAPREPGSMISVGDSNISTEQVQLSYQFNPFLFKIKNEAEAKKRIISSLIARQLLALDADENGFKDSTIDRRIEAHYREAVIETFRMDSVEKTIRINTKELKKEYLRALQEIEIASFVLKADKKQKVNQKVLTWPIQNPALEDIAYTLQEGQESKPIRTGNGVFSIKILHKNRLKNPTAQDFEDRKQALSDHIIRRKIRQKYTRFFHTQIEPLMGTVNKETYTALSALLARKLTVGIKQPTGLFGSEKELPDKVLLDKNLFAKNVQSRPVISFPSGETWSVKKLLGVLKYGPYVFNFSTPQSFRNSLKYNVKLLLEHQAVYVAAEKAGYGKHRRVRHETAMWDRYYKSEAYRHKLLEKVGQPNQKKTTKGALTEIQQKRLDFMDKRLVGLLDRYKVTINRNALAHLKLEKTDMVLMKSHFAHRLVVPLVEPLGGLPEWQKKMSKLFSKYQIH